MRQTQTFKCLKVVLRFQTDVSNKCNSCLLRGHMYLSFRCLALTWVICPLEKSNTSSLRSFRMIMLFWQRLSLVRLAPTMSLMNVGQCFGHSCFRIWTNALQNDKYFLTLQDNHLLFTSKKVPKVICCSPVPGSCSALLCKLLPSASEYAS